MVGADEVEAVREEDACAGEEEEGIVRGGAKLEEVLRGAEACECSLKRGLGGRRSTGLGASSSLLGAVMYGCEGVCEAETDCGTLVGAASVMGISIGTDGVLCRTPAGSVCIGPTGADLYGGCGVRRS